MKPKPRSEREVTRDIVDYMQYCGYTAIRCVAGPVRSIRHGQDVPEQSNPPGFPDWCFVRALTTRKIHNSSVSFYEIKKPSEKPTPLQLAWLERLRKEGFAADWFDGFRAPEGKKPFLEEATS